MAKDQVIEAPTTKLNIGNPEPDIVLEVWRPVGYLLSEQITEKVIAYGPKIDFLSFPIDFEEFEAEWSLRLLSFSPFLISKLLTYELKFDVTDEAIRNQRKTLGRNK